MNNTARAVACAVYAMVLVLMLELGLFMSGQVLLVALALVVAVAVVVILQPSLESLALALTYVFAFTTSWQVVSLGPVRPSDLCFLGALIVFVLASAGRADRWPRIPAWVWQLGIVIVIVGALNEMVPYDPNYLAHRVFLDSNGTPAVQPLSNIGLTSKWLIGVLGVVALIGFAVRAHPRAMIRIATAYAAGSGVNGFVSISDRLHLTNLGPHLLGVTYGDRQTGLTLHPNHLAESCTLAAPVACWLVSRYHGWRRGVALLAVVGTVGGSYLSGSRGGAAVVVLAVIASFALLRSLRARVVQLAGVGGIALLAVFVLYPGLVDTVATTSRFKGDSTTDFSDQARALLAAQADTDFSHSPIYGNGLNLALSAHDLYRQTLAAGGILLLASLVIFLVFSLNRAFAFARLDPLGTALAVTIAAFAVLGTVENFLTDRYIYIPFALAIMATAPGGLPWRRPSAPADASSLPSAPAAVTAG